VKLILSGKPKSTQHIYRASCRGGFLRDTYLTADDPDYVVEPRAPTWLLNYVRADLAPDVLPLIEKLIDRNIEKVNALDLHDSTGGFALGRRTLSLGTLFLALLQSGQQVDPATIADRLKDEHAQDAFFALAAEAPVMGGQTETALQLAEKIRNSKYRPELIVTTLPSSYAWKAICIMASAQVKPASRR
jgi:hypothetical protein